MRQKGEQTRFVSLDAVCQASLRAGRIRERAERRGRGDPRDVGASHGLCSELAVLRRERGEHPCSTRASFRAAERCVGQALRPSSLFRAARDRALPPHGLERGAGEALCWLWGGPGGLLSSAAHSRPSGCGLATGRGSGQHPFACSLHGRCEGRRVRCQQSPLAAG